MEVNLAKDLTLATQYKSFFNKTQYNDDISFYFWGGAIGTCILFFIGLYLAMYFRRYRLYKFEKRPIISEPIFSAFLFILSLCVLTFSLNIESLHYMEATYIKNYPATSLRRIILYGMTSNHFPLYGVFLKFVSIVSMKIQYYRFFSVLFYSISVVAFYQISLLFFEKAKLITLLFMLSGISLYYAKIAEPYALVLCCSSLFIYFFVRLEKSYSNSILPLISIMVVGAYTEQFFILASANFIGLFIIVNRKSIELIKRLLFILGVVLILTCPLFWFEATMIPYVDILTNAQKDIFRVPEAAPIILALRDFIRFLGLNIHLLNKLGVLLWGVVLLVLMSFLFLLKKTKKFYFVVFFSISQIVLYLFLTIVFYYVFSSKANAWYPIWRHGITFVPYLFLLVGVFLDSLYKSRKTLIFVFYCFIVISQAFSAYKILFKKNIPDSRLAWKTIKDKVKGGDAFVATPGTMYMFSTFGYYFLKAKIDNPRPYWEVLGDGKSVLAKFHDKYASIKSMGNNLFLHRLWNIRYNFKFFGLYEEKGKQGQIDFDNKLSRWPILEEYKIGEYLSIRLYAAPKVGVINQKKLLINVGENDLTFCRNLIPTEFKKSLLRILSESSEIAVPKSKGREPFRLTFFFRGHKRTFEIGGGNLLHLNNFTNYYSIHLGTLKGAPFESIEIEYR